VIRVVELPLPAPFDKLISEDYFLISLTFGLKADKAKKRFKLSYVPPAQSDKWYVYLKIEPKIPDDRADFAETRLVLSRTTFLPRQVSFQQPNGNEITWDFPRLVTGAAPRPADFEVKLPGDDWRFIRMRKRE